MLENLSSADTVLLCKDEVGEEDDCLGKATLRDASCFVLQILREKGPQPTECDELTKGYGVRYRNADGSRDQQEVYLGAGDLGVGSNRVAAMYPWNGGAAGTTYYPLEFTFDPSADALFQYVSDFMNPTNAAALVYADALARLSSIEGITPADLNLIEIIVANNDSNPDSVIKLTELRLETSTYTHTLGSFEDMQGGSSAVFKFTWPDDGSSPADGFRFTGKILLTGPFTGSGNERTRVDIQVLKCDEE